MSLGHLGTVVRLPDGRLATVCYNMLDGVGVLLGEHDFSHIEDGGHMEDDRLPRPDYMLRSPGEPYAKNHPTAPCICSEYMVEIVKKSPR